MHTTTFAALANMAPHCQNLHPYAAQRMVGVLQLLTRKYEKLTARLSALRQANVGAVTAAATSDAVSLSVVTNPAGAVDDEATVSNHTVEC